MGGVRLTCAASPALSKKSAIGYVSQVEKLPKAVNHIDPLRITVDPHANIVAQWHHIVGMKNMHAPPEPTQLRCQPLHLGSVGGRLVADQYRDVGCIQTRCTLSEGA